MARPSSVLRAALAALPVIAFPALLAAQQAPERYAPVLLEAPASTRAMALGDAYVAMSDADAVFYNPAQLVPARGLHLAAQRYGSASTLGTMSAATSAGSGGLAAGVQFLDYGAACAACPAAIPVGEGALLERGDFPTSSFAVTVAYARPVLGVRVGVAAKYVEQRIPTDRDGTLAADVGMAADVGPLWVGASAQHLGSGVNLAGERWRLPQRYTVGVGREAIPVGPLDVAASAAVWATANGDVTPALGVELGWMPLEGYSFQGRAGVRATHDDRSRPLSLGAALLADRFTIEYAWRPFEGTGDAHRIGLRWR